MAGLLELRPDDREDPMLDLPDGVRLDAELPCDFLRGDIPDDVTLEDGASLRTDATADHGEMDRHQAHLDTHLGDPRLLASRLVPNGDGKFRIALETPPALLVVPLADLPDHASDDEPKTTMEAPLGPVIGEIREDLDHGGEDGLDEILSITLPEKDVVVALELHEPLENGRVDLDEFIPTGRERILSQLAEHRLRGRLSCRGRL